MRPVLASGFAEHPALLRTMSSVLNCVYPWGYNNSVAEANKSVLSCSGRNKSSKNPAVETQPKQDFFVKRC